MLLSGYLEGMHGAEALAVFEILQQAQHNHGDGSEHDDIGMLETTERAQERNDDAGSGEHGQSERVDLAALDEFGELFAVEYFGHENESLLAVREKSVCVIFWGMERKPVKTPLKETNGV